MFLTCHWNCFWVAIMYVFTNMNFTSPENDKTASDQSLDAVYTFKSFIYYPMVLHNCTKTPAPLSHNCYLTLHSHTQQCFQQKSNFTEKDFGFCLTHLPFPSLLLHCCLHFWQYGTKRSNLTLQFLISSVLYKTMSIPSFWHQIEMLHNIVIVEHFILSNIFFR